MSTESGDKVPITINPVLQRRPGLPGRGNCSSSPGEQCAFNVLGNSEPTTQQRTKGKGSGSGVGGAKVKWYQEHRHPSNKVFGDEAVNLLRIIT